jgi:hypothetical protein
MDRHDYSQSKIFQKMVRKYETAGDVQGPSFSSIRGMMCFEVIDVVRIRSGEKGTGT